MRMRRQMMEAGFAAWLVLGAGQAFARFPEVDVATDQSSYEQGDPIQITTYYWRSQTLTFSTSQQMDYRLDGAYRPWPISLQVITYATGPFMRSMTFDWSNHLLAPGLHSVVGIIPGWELANPTSAPAYFWVTPLPKPQTDFLIDFQQWPGKGNRIDNLVVYEVFGLRFRTSLGSSPYYTYSDHYRNFSLSGFDPYPIGYNVAVDFDLPVNGARAYVGGTSNTTVTMIAKDTHGEVLASAMSPVLGATRVPVEIWTDRLIASLEWWPSITNSEIAVDDLLVRVAPTVNPVVSNGSYRLTWPAVTGGVYRLWSSSNLLEWIPAGPPTECAHGTFSNDCPMAGSTSLFFRVSRIQEP